MLRIGLERLFELPIIQAPKRNSKLHNEMLTISPFLPRQLGAPFVCAALRAASGSAKTDVGRIDAAIIDTTAVNGHGVLVAIGFETGAEGPTG